MECPECHAKRPDEDYKEGKCPACRCQLKYLWGDIPQLMQEGRRLSLVRVEGDKEDFLVFNYGPIGVCLDANPPMGDMSGAPPSRHRVFIQGKDMDRVLVGRDGKWLAVGPWIEAWHHFLHFFRDEVGKARKHAEAYAAEQRAEELEAARTAINLWNHDRAVVARSKAEDAAVDDAAE